MCRDIAWYVCIHTIKFAECIELYYDLTVSHESSQTRWSECHGDHRALKDIVMQELHMERKGNRRMAVN